MFGIVTPCNRLTVGSWAGPTVNFLSNYILYNKYRQILYKFWQRRNNYGKEKQFKSGGR